MFTRRATRRVGCERRAAPEYPHDHGAGRPARTINRSPAMAANQTHPSEGRLLHRRLLVARNGHLRRPPCPMQLCAGVKNGRGAWSDSTFDYLAGYSGAVTGRHGKRSLPVRAATGRLRLPGHTHVERTQNINSNKGTKKCQKPSTIGNSSVVTKRSLPRKPAAYERFDCTKSIAAEDFDPRLAEATIPDGPRSSSACSIPQQLRRRRSARRGRRVDTRVQQHHRPDRVSRKSWKGSAPTRSSLAGWEDCAHSFNGESSRPSPDRRRGRRKIDEGAAVSEFGA